MLLRPVSPFCGAKLDDYEKTDNPHTSHDHKNHFHGIVREGQADQSEGKQVDDDGPHRYLSRKKRNHYPNSTRLNLIS